VSVLPTLNALPDQMLDHRVLAHSQAEFAGKWKSKRLAEMGDRMEQQLRHAESDAIWLGQRTRARWRLVQDHHDLTMISQGLGLSILPRLTCQLVSDSLNFKIVPLAVEPIQCQWSLYLSAAFNEEQQKLLSDALIVALRRLSEAKDTQ